MSFVLDSSVAIAWCIPEENTPELSELFHKAMEQMLIVPSIWPIEMANVLGQAHKVGRISRAGIKAAFLLLAQFNVAIQPSWTIAQAEDAHAAIGQYGLSAYDAGYLLLALELKLPLATLDRKLGAAAQTAGVPLML